MMLSQLQLPEIETAIREMAREAADKLFEIDDYAHAGESHLSHDAVMAAVADVTAGHAAQLYPSQFKALRWCYAEAFAGRIRERFEARCDAIRASTN